MEPSAQPAPPAQIPPSKGGCACCAMGCTSMFVLALVALAVILSVGWWGFGRIVNEYTANGSVEVRTETTEQDFTAANEKLNTMREAARTDQSVTVEFSAPELNALIARHPDFEEMRGKFRVAMADSLMTLEMSVPLSAIDLPRIRDRWLNGTARFGIIYHDGNFSFSLRSLTANENDLSLNFLESFASSFNDKFNEGFRESRSRHGRSDDFWENVKTLAVVDDKLVLTTIGPDRSNDAGTTDEAEPTPTPETL